MPKCGTQIVLCNFPVRFDTYLGCSHRCSFCFAQRKNDIGKIKVNETDLALRNFIAGKRAQETAWCDWNIPLHWGGMSDPFQPIEAVERVSYRCLAAFAETQYPFIFSTKGRLAWTDEYLAAFAACNCVGQVSMVSPRYDQWEPGAPPFDERLVALGKLAKVTKRLVVRVSPYVLGLVNELCALVPKYRDLGVYGISIEGMKRSKKYEGMEKLAGDYVYLKTGCALI
jgi:DNA repair photolyase